MGVVSSVGAAHAVLLISALYYVAAYDVGIGVWNMEREKAEQVLEAVLFTIDSATGKCLKAERVDEWD